MNIKIVFRLCAFTAISTLLASCATQQQTNTAVGTGIGAGLGAGIGALIGGGKGAAIGGAVGAAAGGVTGYNWQAIHNRLTGATAGTGTKITEQPDGSLKVNIPSSISFDTNSYAIKPSFAPVLNSVARELAQYPELTAKVIGYTDNTGSPQFNQVLSQNRAQSVTTYLSQHGVASPRLTAQGLGELQPVASNATAAGRAQNRRVEIYLRAMTQPGQTAH